MNTFLKKAACMLAACLLFSVAAPFNAFAATKGDVNDNGKINIVDAQIAYDIACGSFADDSNYGALRAAADVNEDGSVDAADSFAIQRYVFTGTFDEPAASAPLTIDSYVVSGSVVTATFTYTNMRDRDSSAGVDYSFAAHQDGYALSECGYGDDYFARVMPGYRSTFTLSWRMRTDGDVTVAATAGSLSNGASAEKVLRVS